jgi:hypothetical protein
MKPSFLFAAAVLLASALGALPAGAEEPALPLGLEEEGEPALPLGLAEEGEPALPTGLDAESEPALPEGLLAPAETQVAGEAVEDEAPHMPFGLSGFWEARGGGRLQNDSHEREASVAETRLQLEADKGVGEVAFRLTADFVLDGLADSQAVDLETGEGFVDLREANLTAPLAESLDIKAGRQILTWGTGDLIFINDLFPKDRVSFFVGRDAEYLKAPSDAVKLSAFTDWTNIDLVYTPRFDADRFIDGRRISFFDSSRGRIVGRDAVARADRPDRLFGNDEWAARIYRTIAGYELALYGYDGYWKSPAGNEAGSGEVIFPRLRVYGASARGPVGGGVAHVETGYLDSRDDRDGENAVVRNGEMRFLVGYERELAVDLTLGGQYYLEHVRHRAALIRTLPAGGIAPDENRHVITGRLTWLTDGQTVTWSLFAFYSPSDRDGYLRPHVSYDLTDQWRAELGGNIFLGREDHTFFGQFEDNNNLYAALRYGF